MIEREELVREFIESIDVPVIVEGKNDVSALRGLGVENIVPINTGGSLLDVVESLKDFDRVVILTDFDQAGKILRKKLLELFGHYGIHESRRPRELFARLRLSHVEGLRRIDAL